MQHELIAFVRWYNDHRPSQALALGGLTPAEKRDSTLPAREGPRIEPRPRYRTARGGHVAELVRRAPQPLRLVVTHIEGRKHLPFITLEAAAMRSSAGSAIACSASMRRS